MRLCAIVGCAVLFWSVQSIPGVTQPKPPADAAAPAKPEDIKATAEKPTVGDVSRPNFQPLLDKFQVLVRKYYPKARTSKTDKEFHFEFDKVKFLIHDRLLTGEWQDAREVWGPGVHGIVGEIRISSGQYKGMVEVPQTFDKRYFKLRLMAPYSKKLDHHLHVQLKLPDRAPKKFLKELEMLVADFENQLSTPVPAVQLPSVKPERHSTFSALEAVRMAENYLESEKLDVSKHFIELIKFEYDSSLAVPCWLIIYRWGGSKNSSPGEVLVYVGIDGQCSHFAQR